MIPIACTRGFAACPLVSYIVVAEFDINTGSTVRHQYPGTIPDYKEDFLAENMLPEGIHNRDMDCTYIFLNRNSRQIDEQAWLHPLPKAREEAEDSERWFMCGFNMVKRHRDESVRRGAIVKAICIFSRYHFIEEFKMPLEKALDAYFSSPTIAILEQLFTSLNNVNLSSLPRPTYLERCLMRRAVGVSPQFLGKTIAEHLPHYFTFTLEVVIREPERIGTADCQVSELKSEAEVEFTDTDKDQTTTGLVSSNEPIVGGVNNVCQVNIPLWRSPDELGELSVIKLIKRFGENTMRIYNAVLRRQRVLFVGYNHAAIDVAQMVFAAVALVSPIIPNVIRRAFSYANLTDLSFLEVPGYISGVTNPMFQQKESWWDLLCVLEASGGGSVIESESALSESIIGVGGGFGAFGDGSINPGIISSVSTTSNSLDTHSYSDSRFYSSLLSGIAANCGEHWVRQRFLDLTSFILNQAQDQPSLLLSTRLNDKLRKQLEANVNRSNRLKGTPEVVAMPLHPWEWTGTPCEGYELRMHIRRLQCESGLMSTSEVEPMFSDILKVLQTEADVQALISILPESQGGIFPIAVGLFSPNPKVKASTVMIMERIREYDSTRPAFEGLNSILSNAFLRLKG